MHDRYRYAPAYLAVLLGGVLPVLLAATGRGAGLSPGAARTFFQAVVALLPVAVVFAVCRALSRRGGEPAAVGLVLAALAALLEYVHHSVVDYGHYFSPDDYADNLHWQIWLHGKVLALSPDVLPHSYRFLPNGIVALLEGLTGDFLLAKTAYRFVFGFGLLCAIYLLARQYVSRPGAMLAVVLYAAVYPVGILYYAGQLADPLSHLSFVLALLFIRLRRDFDFLATLLVGLLAKESVMAVVACYVVAAWRRGERAAGVRRGALYAGLGLVVLATVRLAVLRTGGGYDKVSGVGLEHVVRNLGALNWPLPLFFSVGVFLPVLVVHWRKLPIDLRDDILVLLPALLLSSLFFSWLAEARNYMPLSALLCIATVHLLEDRFAASNSPSEPDA
jgi:hypothetical protein